LKVSKIKKTENFNDQIKNYVHDISDSSCNNSDCNNHISNKKYGKKTHEISSIDNYNNKNINKLINNIDDKFNNDNVNICDLKNENVVNTSDITNLHFKSKNNRLYQNENGVNCFDENYNWNYNKNDLDDVKKVHYTKLTSILNENNFDIIKNSENSQCNFISKVPSVNGLSYLQQKPLNYMMPPDLAPQKKNKKY
ncbi:hypothetical protein HEP_00522600, partial [Hepatocystis sp. ex Piliocolobus tephrosceles]